MWVENLFLSTFESKSYRKVTILNIDVKNITSQNIGVAKIAARIIPTRNNTFQNITDLFIIYFCLIKKKLVLFLAVNPSTVFVNS